MMFRQCGPKNISILKTPKRKLDIVDLVPKVVAVVQRFVPMGFDGMGQEYNYTKVKDECTIFCYLEQERVLSFTMGMARKNRANVWIHCQQFAFPGSIRFYATNCNANYQFIAEGWNPYFYLLFLKDFCNHLLLNNLEEHL